MTKTRTAIASADLVHLFTSGTLVGLSDRALLDRFTESRDARAFAMLVQRHGRQVWAECRSVLGDSHSADDAFQATFLILVRKAATVEVGDSLGRWLHGVSRRVAVRARRRHRLAARLPDREIPSDADPVGTDLVARESAAMIREEVGNLPPSYREPILACYFEGLSHEEAASRLRCPIGTVKGRLSRARALLRDRLARRGLGASPGVIAATLKGESARAAVPSRLIEATVGAASVLSKGPTAALVGTIPAGVLSLMNGVLATMSWTKMTISAAMLAIGCASISTGALIGGFGPSAIGSQEAPEVRPASRVVADGDPENRQNAASEQAPATTNPWKTVVRIKIHDETTIPKTLEMASGVVVRSVEGEALILTSAHNFGKSIDPFDPMGGFPHRIDVDGFSDALAVAEAKEQTVMLRQTYDGRLMKINHPMDLALVQIQPRERLPVSPVTEKEPAVVKGQSLVSYGCSEGNNPTSWTTNVVNPLVRGVDQFPEYEGILCEFQPKQGRSGGGLFNQEGELVGICNVAEPNGKRGLYAHARMIRKFLSLAIHDEPPMPRPRPAVSPKTDPDHAPREDPFPEPIRAANARKPASDPFPDFNGFPNAAPAEKTYPVVYSLADLALRRGAKADRADFDSLVDLIMSTVSPGTWKLDEADRDPAHIGSIMPFFPDSSLIIRHNAKTHNQIVERLRQLRRLPALRGADEVGETAGNDPAGVQSSPPVVTVQAGGSDPYVIEPPDMLWIEADGPALEPLVGDRLVRPDGTISLGKFGDLHVAGLTTAEAKEKLVIHLRKHVSDEELGLVPQDNQAAIMPFSTPRVRVRVATVASKVYYVLGLVADPGRFPWTRRTTVLDALQYAGGLRTRTEAGNELRVDLVRKAGLVESKPQRLNVDVRAILKQANTKTNYVLEPGDRIFVTEIPPIRPVAEPASPANPAISASPADLSARIEALEKELQALKEQQPR